MATSLTFLLPGRGDHLPYCCVVSAIVLDHLTDDGMELKVYRKETKKSK